MNSIDKLVTAVLSFTETHNIDYLESDIQALKAESMGWFYLSESAYLNEGKDGSSVIQVIGIAQIGMSESNILWSL
jgi:hypothetical protein